MEKFIIVFLILNSLYACTSNKSNGSKIQKKTVVKNSIQSPQKVNPIEKGQTVKLFVNTEHSFDFIFLKSNSTEFNAACKKALQPKFKIRSTAKVVDVTTAFQTYQFNHYNPNNTQTGDRGYEFLEYDNNSKIYSLYHHFQNDDFGFTKLELIDSVTDYKYEFEVDNDFPFEKPVFSTSCSFFVTYINNLFEDNGSTLVLFKLNSKKDPKSYIQFIKSSTIVDFNIELVCWKNDSTLLLKCFKIIEENEEMKKEVFYQKAIIK